MNTKNIDVYLENQSLRKEFEIRNLDLSQVFIPAPGDLQRENRLLRHLLDWVQAYNEFGDREEMEKRGYDFPPIEPDISPDDDWYENMSHPVLYHWRSCGLVKQRKTRNSKNSEYLKEIGIILSLSILMTTVTCLSSNPEYDLDGS